MREELSCPVAALPIRIGTSPSCVEGIPGVWGRSVLVNVRTVVYDLKDQAPESCELNPRVLLTKK